MVEQSNDAVQSAIMKKKLRRLDGQAVATGAEDLGQMTVVATTHVSDDGTSVVCPTELPHMKVAAQNDVDNSADDDKTAVATVRDDRTVFDEDTAWFDADYRLA